jgi:phosphoribosylformylglycinamidine synthase
VKHGEGRYVASAETLAELEGEGRVAFRYLGVGADDGNSADDPRRPANPNGSLNDIAGIVSADGRVVGLMPHPEHAIESLTGPSEDGLGLFVSALQSLGVAA